MELPQPSQIKKKKITVKSQKRIMQNVSTFSTERPGVQIPAPSLI